MHYSTSQTSHSGQIWSSMSIYGTGQLSIFQGNKNQQQNRELLENQLIPQLCEWSKEKGFTVTGGFICMHDSAPCHNKREGTHFLEGCDIELLL
ncbi:unnamed protein product [Dicrocoelium dendriticum]|nr:unnamed protein product [Dicrocoelium dendriticum]